jgi:iron complex outermembrane receptor protein
MLQAATAFSQASDDESDLVLAYGDKSSISIATGRTQSLRRAPAVASVVTAEDIAAMGATDIDQVLESMPGVHVSRSSVRYASIYTIRGLGAGLVNPQILLMQNGIPMTTMFNGDKGSAWAGVPVENVARIEVIRGPGSALYGADAFAGVINVITKTAAETPGSEFGVRAGSFGTADAWVQHGGTHGPLEVAGFLRAGTADGFKETVVTRFGPAGPVNAGYDAVDGSLNVAYDAWRLRASYKLRDRLGTGAGIGMALDPASKARAEELTTDLSWTEPRLSENWGAGATVSALYYSVQYLNNVVMLPASVAWSFGGPTGVPQIGGPNQWERQFRYSGFANFKGFAGHEIRIGLGHDNLDLYKARTYRDFMFNAAGRAVYTGPTVIDYTATQPHIRPQSRTVDYTYIQDEWQLAADWELTAGVRRDVYSDFGGTTNPRVALVWEAAYNVTAKLLYGRAFRAPAFNELYGVNPTANGNPALQPEKIGTGEAALSWQVRRDLALNASLFRSDAKDLIRLVGTRYANTGSQHGTGMEVEAVWDPGRNLRLTANYSTQKSIDEASDQDAGYAPHRHAYLRADWQWNAGWMASAQLNDVGDRRRPAGDTRKAVPDYTTLDLILRTAGGTRQWNFAAALRNVTNANVIEPSFASAPGTPVTVPSDLPQPRRSFYLEASYRL